MGLSLLERSRLADALDLWRAGERHVTRRLLTPDWRDDDQDAVQAALLHLQRYSTMAELLVAYFDLDDDTWLDAPCRPPSGRILNVGDEEDAAYWRRARQLITGPATANRPGDPRTPPRLAGAGATATILDRRRMMLPPRDLHRMAMGGAEWTPLLSLTRCQLPLSSITPSN